MKLKKLLVLGFGVAGLALNANAIVQPAPVFKKLKQEGALVYYSGSATLQGEFWYPISNSEREVIGDQLCFDVPDPQSKLIPREADDQRSTWFCFKDTQQAIKQLGLTELAKQKVCELRGTATVEVTNYVVDKEQTDTNDRAELVAVIKPPEAVTLKLLGEEGASCQE